MPPDRQDPDPQPKRLPPAKKGSKRAFIPEHQYSLEERLVPINQTRIDAAQAAARKYLQRVRCVICAQNQEDNPSVPLPRIVKRSTGELFDVQGMYLHKPPPAWKVPIILGWMDPVHSHCMTKWMVKYECQGAAAKKRREEKIRAAHARSKLRPIINKKAWKIAKQYLYAALKAKDPARKRQLYIWHYQWDDRARRPVTDGETERE